MKYKNHGTSILDIKFYLLDEDGNEKEFTVPMTVTFLWPTIDL